MLPQQVFNAASPIVPIEHDLLRRLAITVQSGNQVSRRKPCKRPKMLLVPYKLACPGSYRNVLHNTSGNAVKCPGDPKAIILPTHAAETRGSLRNHPVCAVVTSACTKAEF